MLVPTRRVAPMLAAHHYLGPTTAGFAWLDEFGAIVFARPRSRRMPTDWLEVVRWCLLVHDRAAGSRQWSAVSAYLRATRRDVTTIVSYSDPAQNHSGALYRACNWLWAPTWHRLRPPPTGNGKWTAGGKVESVKDRWVFPLRQDDARARALAIEDESVARRFPWASYREPHWKRGRFNPASGGGEWKRFVAQQPTAEVA